MTTTYQHHFKDGKGVNHNHMGHAVMLNPQVYFAANDQITLSSGLTWPYLGMNHHHHARHTVNQASLLDRSTDTATTTTGLNLGLAYLYSPQTTLLLRNHFDMTGGGGAEIGVSVQMKL